MVKRSHVYCSSGGNRRSVVVTVGALVLYILLCSGAVFGTSIGDRSLYFTAASAELTASAARYVDDTASVAGAAARSGRSAANLSHITGTSRKIKMFVKVASKYLQVFPNGSVSITAEEDSDYVILQRSSVNMGQLKIQGVATCMYLCMDACGLLYGSKEFMDECVFNEMIEEHNYNAYSSAKYTNEKRTLYLALDKQGSPRRVQVKANGTLGKLSAYTQVLPEKVLAERMEQLLATRKHRHHHGCPPHTGPPHATAKHRRKCHTRGKGQKKSREEVNKNSGGSKEDEDCGDGGNNTNGRCGGGADEISHRKTDAAGRKKKSKKPTAGGGKGAAADKPRRKHGGGKAKKTEPVAPTPEPATVIQTVVTTAVAPSQLVDEDNDDDDADDAAPAATAPPPDEFLEKTDN